MKEKIKKEYFRRTRKILSTELSSKNKITAIGSLAIPVLEYGFGVIKWKIDEIRNLDRKTRKCLTMNKMLHPKADVDRLYAKRKDGGRGLRQVEQAYKSKCINTELYIRERRNQDVLLNEIFKYDETQPKINSILKKSKQYKDEINHDDNDPTYYKKQKTIVKQKINEKIKTNWESKQMHGQFIRQINQDPNINKNQSFNWLSKCNLKGETESLLTAAQDQALNTKYHAAKILKVSSDSKCRICKNFDETVHHIMSGCPKLAQKEYIERHDNVGKIIHFEICKSLNMELETNKWYEHKPKQVMSNDKYTVLWNQQIRTDRTILANKPDIVVHELGKSCVIIDVSVPYDSNIHEKEGEKILKYKDLK
ncbi:hypothetical protein WDU94_009865 [Cyamophila willieti]